MKNPYKILGLVLICLSLSVVYSYADSVYGTMWKQEDTVVYPADDVTKVDFNNISTVNMLGAGSDCTTDCTFDNVSTGTLTAGSINAGLGVFDNISTQYLDVDGTGAQLVRVKYGGLIRFVVTNVGNGYFQSGANLIEFQPGSGLLRFTGVEPLLSTSSSNKTWNITSGSGYSTSDDFMSLAPGTITNSSGDFNGMLLSPIYNQSGTAGYNTIFINQSTITEGSGEKSLIRANNDNLEIFKISSDGSLSSGLNASASGLLAMATGSSVTASGALSRAGGTNATSSGSQSWAYGDTVTASGDNSFVSGNQVIAKAAGSMARGGFLNISTDAAYSVMFGSYVNATERDENKLTNASTMRLASMNFEVEGSIAFKAMTSITGDYNIPSDIYFIECDATLANVSTFLPSYANMRGKLIEVKKIDSSGNGCYIDGNGAETIDGATGQEITTQYGIVRMISGATEWLTR